MGMNNMVLFDGEGKLQKYETVLDILKEFAILRITMYEKRKTYLLNRLTRECEILSAKARFIKLVIEGELVIRRRKIADLIQELRRRGFKALNELKGQGSIGKAEEDDAGKEDDNDGDDNENGEDDDDVDDDDTTNPEKGEDENEASKIKRATVKGIRDFEYLVGMPIATLTLEKIEELMREHEHKIKQLDTLRRKTPSQLWLDDLDDLEKMLHERDAKNAEEDRIEQEKIQKARAKAERGKEKNKGTRGTKRAV